MSIHIDFFADKGVRVTTTTHAATPKSPKPFATLRTESTDDSITFFIYDLETVDKLAFEFSNMSRILRDEHGWTTKTDTDNNTEAPF